MNSFSLSYSAGLLGARLVGADAFFHAVSSDSRTLQERDLFVALRGPNFDGHAYLESAQSQGAAGALVNRTTDTSLAQLVVADTRKALGSLAAGWLEAFRRPVAAVTGSNGKTTVKEMLASILARRGRVLATRGNLNNAIGLPLTLLRLQDEDYLVVEMGASHRGEIGYLSAIARPDVAVLTNAGNAHLEGFGSLEQVARAKGEIVRGLQAAGTLVLNADDPWSPVWRQLAGAHRVVGFGTAATAEVTSDLSVYQTRWDQTGLRSLFPVVTPQGEIEVELALAGHHNRMNALAAVAAAQALGATLGEIRAGLAAVQPIPGRMQTVPGASGWHLIDDTYNANPDSVSAAIAVLRDAPGERWLVLGDLAELGPETERLHRGVGAAAAEAGIDRLCTLGEVSRAASDAFGVGARHFSDRLSLLAHLRRHLDASSWILVKGSRSARMEQVVKALTEQQAG